MGRALAELSVSAPRENQAKYLSQKHEKKEKINAGEELGEKRGKRCTTKRGRGKKEVVFYLT